MTWGERAEALLDAVVETGGSTADVTAAAWRAGVDTNATDGLTGAALALHAPVSALLAGGLRPLPNDVEMLTRAADLETDALNHLDHARRLSDQVAAAAAAAARAAEVAREWLRKAEGPGEARAADKDLRRALADIADCEYTMEILADLGQRLQYACDCLTRVPDDLAATYERPYEHLRAGRTMPSSGLFLTGAQA